MMTNRWTLSIQQPELPFQSGQKFQSIVKTVRYISPSLWLPYVSLVKLLEVPQSTVCVENQT